MSTTKVRIIIGAYGSGKTEAAINLALREQGAVLVDLDIVNPYFRSRDAREALAVAGIKVISSSPGMEEADLPSISPAILGILQTPGQNIIFDVGGDPVGARALGRFHQLLINMRPEVWAVVNPYRPGTRTAEQVAQILAAMSQAARLEVTGLVANPNLGPETAAETVLEGGRRVREAAAALGLPVVMTCVRADLIGGLDTQDLGPILPIRRYMLLPWEKNGG